MNRASIFLLATLLTLGFAFAPSALAQSTDKAIQPVLQVPIPGLNFEGSVIHGSVGDDATKEQENCGEGYVCVTTIGDYLNGVYRYLVAAGVLLTIVLIMVGGVEYMLGSATGGVARAVTRIRNATIGLILVLSAAVIVTFINPDIPSLNTLRIKAVPRAPALIKADNQNPVGVVASVSANLYHTSVTPDENGNPQPHPYIEAVTGPDELDETVGKTLQEVANELFQKRQQKLYIMNAYVNPEKLARRFFDNCIKNNCQSQPYCNPFPPSANIIEGDLASGYSLTSAFHERVKGMPDAEIYTILDQEAAKLTQTACPYATGYAVGVTCGSDSISRVDAECHIVLEQIMQSKGFCRSEYSPWHFEWGQNKSSADVSCAFVPGEYIVPESLCNADENKPCTRTYDSCTQSVSNFGGTKLYYNFYSATCSN